MAVLALAAGPTAGLAQVQPRYTITAPDSAGTTALPFELVANHVVIPAVVNGSDTVRLVLDTGMPMAGVVLFRSPRVEALDLQFSMSTLVGGAGGSGSRQPADIALNVTIALPGVTIEGARAIVLPPGPAGHHDGIIGASIFGHFVVELDFETHTIRLVPPERYVLPATAHVIPLTLRGFATLAATVTPRGGEPTPIHLVVDLGAAHALSLGLAPPPDAIDGILGRGLGGHVTGKVGRIASLTLGDLTLNDVVTSFPIADQSGVVHQGTDGNLGADFLRRFCVTFDYAHSRMVLQPTAAVDAPFEWDMSGIAAEGDSSGAVRVVAVVPDSPAHDAGLTVGDVITALDGTPVTPASYLRRKEEFKRAGTTVTVRYRRGEREHEATLVLRRLV